MSASSSSRYQVLSENPASRLPVCLLVDRSYSMRVVSGGTPTGETIVKDGRTFSIVNGGTNQLIETLLAGVGSFARDILADSRALASVEMAIISFGDSVRIERDFMAVDSSLSSFSIEAIDDGTRLGQAVRTALELLDRRKGEYKEFGIKPFQPQIVILTDGCATDPDVCKLAGIEVQQRMKDQKLLCLPFLIGDERDTGSLLRFAPEGKIFRIQGANLAALFSYLSQSAILLSHSNAGGTEACTVEKILRDLESVTVSVGAI